MFRYSALAAFTAALTLATAGSALAAPGDTDPSFGSGGVVVSNLNPFDGTSFDDVAIEPDGKIVALEGAFGTNIQHLRRYLPDGTPDSTFGEDGISTVPDHLQPTRLAIQPDGKIVVAGGDGSDFTVARFLANGVLDPAFDGNSGTGNGIVRVSLTPGNDFVHNVAIDSKGRIVLAGTVNSTASTGAVGVARLLSDGKLDTSFHGSGFVVFDLLVTEQDVWAMAVQPDNKIVIGGQWGSFPGYDTTVQRFTESGGVDSTFGGSSTGQKIFNLGDNDKAAAISIQPGGAILVGVNVDGDPTPDRLVRLTSSAAIDKTFVAAGNQALDYTVREISQAPDGKFVVVGVQRQADDLISLVVERRNADGTPDTAFGTGGRVTLRYNAIENSFDRALAVAADGKVLVAGESSVNSSSKAEMLRLLAAPDPAPVPGAPPAPAPADPALQPAPLPALALSKLSLTHRKFAVAKTATAKVATVRGTTFRYTLNRAATVAIHIKALKRGAKAVTLKRRSSAGANRVRFSGRIGRHALPRGRYRTLVSAVDSTGAKTTAHAITFKIVRR